MTAVVARVQRDGECVALSGTLDRDAASALWPQAIAAAARARALDVGAVDAMDSAGLAMLVALVERTPGLRVTGMPQGMSDLLAAYRLQTTLGFDENP